MKFATESYDITQLTLGMLLHYLGKLKIYIFCRYSTDMEEMHFIASNFIAHPQILIFLVFKIASLSHTDCK